MSEEWTIEDFKSFNSNYRKGRDSANIKKEARNLFNMALKARKEPQKTSKIFCKVLKSLTISFEVLEAYIEFDDKVANVCKGYLYFVTKDAPRQITETHFRKKIKSFLKIHKQPDTFYEPADDSQDNIEIFCDVATELLLLSLTGINVLYREYKEKEGLKALKKLFDYIDYLRKVKESSGHRKSNSLFALAKYLEAKLLFVSDEHSKALDSFRTCADEYQAKLLYTDDNDTRAVATRRYASAMILGVAFIHQARGKLNEAVELCKKYSPLLEHSNIILKTYARFIEQIALRGLGSTHLAELDIHLDEFNKILDIFTTNLKNSHYQRRTEYEICLVKMFQAKSTEIITRKKELFDEVLDSVDEIIKSSVCDQTIIKEKNARLKAISYSLKSYALRNYPVELNEDDVKEVRIQVDRLTKTKNTPRKNKQSKYLDIEKERRNLEQEILHKKRELKIKSAIQAAEEAVRISKGKPQLYCESLIEKGLAYQSLFELYHVLYLRVVREQHDLSGGKVKGILTKIRQHKRTSMAAYFTALQINRNQSPKNSAIIWLQLSEIELLHDHNVHFADYNWKQYTKLSPLVEHDYILKFADNIRTKIDRTLLYAPPFFMGEEDDGLDYQDWLNKLQIYLTEKVVVKMIAHLDGELASQDVKNGPVLYENYRTKVGTGSENRRADLQKAFEDQLKFPEYLAKQWADIYINYKEAGEPNKLEQKRIEMVEMGIIRSKTTDLD